MTEPLASADAALDGPLGPTAAPANRLSIAHLLLWMTGTALALVLFPAGWLAAPKRYAFEREMMVRNNAEKVLAIVLAPLYGIAVASLPLAAVRLVERRGGFPTQPGHWLLHILGLGYLLFAVVVEWREGVLHPPGSLVVFLLLAALGAVSLAAFACVRTPGAWRIMFRTVIAGSVVLIAIDIAAYWIGHPLWLLGVGGAFLITAGLIGLLAVVMDLLERAEYDLFHWLGVLVLLGTLAAPLLAYGVARFMV